MLRTTASSKCESMTVNDETATQNRNKNDHDCVKATKPTYTAIVICTNQTACVPECTRRHRQQVRWGVKLDALSLVHHHNLGRIQDGGYAMSYSQHGALDKLPADRLLDEAVGGLQNGRQWAEILCQTRPSIAKTPSLLGVAARASTACDY